MAHEIYVYGDRTSVHIFKSLTCDVYVGITCSTGFKHFISIPPRDAFHTIIVCNDSHTGNYSYSQSSIQKCRHMAPMYNSIPEDEMNRLPRLLPLSIDTNWNLDNYTGVLLSALYTVKAAVSGCLYGKKLILLDCSLDQQYNLILAACVLSMYSNNCSSVQEFLLLFQRCWDFRLPSQELLDTAQLCSCKMAITCSTQKTAKQKCLLM